MLHEILKEAFNAKEDELQNDDQKLTKFREWDSMAHMIFITRLEESYGIMLDGNEIAAMETIADVKRTIASKGKAV